MSAFGARLCLGFVFALSGCSSDTNTPGSPDSIVVTSSVSGTVATVVGGTQMVSLSFDSSDGKSISNLDVTTGSGSPPTGWSGPTSFTCAMVNVGNGCTLNLTYAPSAMGRGTLTLYYNYVDNAGAAKAAILGIPYTATTNNNVTTAAAPIGEVNAVVGGGSQSVALTFTTDDGNPATSLSVTTSLSALPPGWSSAGSSFACATVSTGNGCQLTLTYAPTAVGSGNLSLNFTYTDDAGVAKTGSTNVAYAATSSNNVVGTPSPTGQIAVVRGSSQAVTVTFVTDDGNPASNFAIGTDLAALPAGWSSGSNTFACAKVSTGNGCALGLSYAPTSISGGTLTLLFSYTDNSGAARTGSVNIPNLRLSTTTSSGWGLRQARSTPSSAPDRRRSPSHSIRTTAMPRPIFPSRAA